MSVSPTVAFYAPLLLPRRACLLSRLVLSGSLTAFLYSRNCLARAIFPFVFASLSFSFSIAALHRPLAESAPLVSPYPVSATSDTPRCIELFENRPKRREITWENGYVVRRPGPISPLHAPSKRTSSTGYGPGRSDRSPVRAGRCTSPLDHLIRVHPCPARVPAVYVFLGL